MFNEEEFMSLLTLEWKVANLLDIPKAWAGTMDWLNGAATIAFFMDEKSLSEDLDLLANIAWWRLVYSTKEEKS